ncbi:MAG: aspartate-semialdehyde dehydrogenase [Polyangiaceae bacterium]|nr:aspartate-semialdehyde dehydrogenase [Polyangiaceae bacterium]MCW5789875.1 aspartate-semialdehyde dehydrogenase [Polyangiaceae bacterium]
MSLSKVGLVGWRGMVGSVLLERMQREGDLNGLSCDFFSTSQVGQPGPALGGGGALKDAFDLEALAANQAIITCQGGDYTSQVLPALRSAGWDGYWIDAASTKRMDEDSVIVLDPVNRPVIERAIASGIKNFIGGNCTVSLMLMAICGLYQRGWVEWVSSMTYQAASGAGAAHMRELVLQMQQIGAAGAGLAEDPASAILELDRQVSATLSADDFRKEKFGAALAGSLIPWIDRDMPDGATREEWKGHAESNKILDNDPPIPVDGLCVRVGAMRCHSQALTIKLTRPISLSEVESVIQEGNNWVDVVPNNRDATLAKLSPQAVNGSLRVPIGRIRKLKMGPEYLAAFTVGDQLLWGAAEPLRRALTLLRERV